MFRSMLKFFSTNSISSIGGVRVLMMPAISPNTGIGQGHLELPHKNYYSFINELYSVPKNTSFSTVYLCINKKNNEFGHFTCREFESIRYAKYHLATLNNMHEPSAIVKIPLIYPRTMHASILENKLSQLFIRAEIRKD